MSWLTFCCCIAVIACVVGLFHMARASSRLTSVQINTKKQFLVVMSCSVFTVPPGAHVCLKSANVFTPAVVYSGSVSTANETCNEDKGNCTKKCRCTSYKCTRTFYSGVKFASLEKTTCHHCSILWSDEQASITGLPVLGRCSVHQLRCTFLLSDLVFSGLSYALGISDNGNFVTVLNSIPPAPNLHRSHRACHELIQLLFTDSLASTLLDWLS